MDPDQADHHARLQRALGDTFELGALIGRGGFGDVYAARDRQLDRDVAVKSLRHDLFPTRLVLERFQREARSVARLRHPNILPVYAVGEGEGLAFMIMPLIRGESLAAALERDGAIATEDAVRITTEVARALDAAHRLGILHRDVKPDNILLEGEERHVLLGDFGIAKAMESETDVTGTGVIVGSPQYMSHEQASGERDLDIRSDVYALGAVTYEMLSGHPPYEAPTYQQLLVRQFTSEPTRLSELAPEVEPTVSSVVMRSLARERSDRWSSAGAFASALHTACGSIPVAARVGAKSHESWVERRGPLVLGLGLTMFYLEIAAEVLVAAGDRGATALIRPALTLLQFGIPLLLAELPSRIALIRLGGGSWLSALRATLGQPRWWQAWYPRALRHPANVWDRMSTAMKTLRTILWLDLAAIPFLLPMTYFVPRLTEVASSSNHALPLLMRLVIGASGLLTPLLPVSLVALLGGVLTLSVTKRVSPIRVLECLLTWRGDRWSATEVRRLLSTSAGRPASTG